MQKKIHDYIKRITYKRLSNVDCDSNSSNQHEIGGGQLKTIYGNVDKKNFKNKIIYLCDKEEDNCSEYVKLSFYDVRVKNKNRSSEFRLVYQKNIPMKMAQMGDLIFFIKAIHNKKEIDFIVIIKKDSTTEEQIKWLFGLENSLFSNKFDTKSTLEKEINFLSAKIFNYLQIEIDRSNSNYLDGLLENFGQEFPSTKVFTEYAISLVPNAEPLDDADDALIKYHDMEEILFKTLEKHLVEKKINEGTIDSADELIEFALSILNRRKSRAGHSFENILIYIFQKHKLSFSNNGITENNNKPDFIFPGVEQYHDSGFDKKKLVMLAAKTSLRDRWRQIIPEANNIHIKHLITLEPSISKNQTNQIFAKDIILVIPKEIQSTFNKSQNNKIIDLNFFINYTKSLTS